MPEAIPRFRAASMDGDALSAVFSAEAVEDEEDLLMVKNWTPSMLFMTILFSAGNGETMKPLSVHLFSSMVMNLNLIFFEYATKQRIASYMRLSMLEITDVG